jgi:hypothetical protein
VLQITTEGGEKNLHDAQGIGSAEDISPFFISFFYSNDTNIHTLRLGLKRDINELDPDNIRYKIRIDFDLANTLEFK